MCFITSFILPAHLDDYAFMGSLIIQEVVKELLTKGLDNAKVLLLAGSRSVRRVGVSVFTAFFSPLSKPVLQLVDCFVPSHPITYLNQAIKGTYNTCFRCFEGCEKAKMWPFLFSRTNK